MKNEPIIKLIYRVKNQDGTILRKKTRAFYLDETHEDIILIRRDITDLYEEEQRQKHILQQAAEAANAANRAKSDFFSHMSHDMRTPLNAIMAFSSDEMILDAEPAQRMEYLKKIHSSGEYLLGIINDVLDMSRIENKKIVLHPEPYAINEFEDAISTVIGEQCRKKNIKFIFDVRDVVEPWVSLDKVRFNQIFINLLSNSVKFTPPGGKIEFKIKILDREKNRIKKRFIVQDSGIGMSREFLPHAFESFAQENQNGISENSQGTGLGLAIVKQLVEMMGGSVKVESELGHGTTFTIDLWVETAKPASLESENDIDLALLSGLNILLFEDHPLNAQIDRSLLNKKGCAVDCAENGRIGCEMFESSKEGYYDLILMDIRMPEMDGLEATRTIRAMKRPDAAKIPIIAMTADAFIEDVNSSIAAGMNGHLSKPIDPKLLYSTIAKHVMNKASIEN